MSLLKRDIRIRNPDTKKDCFNCDLFNSTGPRNNLKSSHQKANRKYSKGNWQWGYFIFIKSFWFITLTRSVLFHIFYLHWESSANQNDDCLGPFKIEWASEETSSSRMAFYFHFFKENFTGRLSKIVIFGSKANVDFIFSAIEINDVCLLCNFLPTIFSMTS